VRFHGFRGQQLPGQNAVRQLESIS
jgi:hypothetical protein